MPLWNVKGALQIQKGICVYSNNPCFVMNAVFGLSFSLTSNWWYPLSRSRVENSFELLKVSRHSSILGSGRHFSEWPHSPSGSPHTSAPHYFSYAPRSPASNCFCKYFASSNWKLRGVRRTGCLIALAFPVSMLCLIAVKVPRSHFPLKIHPHIHKATW